MQVVFRVSYTTFPPYFQMVNDSDLSTLNTKTLEYYYMKLFLTKNKKVTFNIVLSFCSRFKFSTLFLVFFVSMRVIFKDANFLFGGWDNKTQSWNGVVGQVGTGLAGITRLSPGIVYWDR